MKVFVLENHDHFSFKFSKFLVPLKEKGFEFNTVQVSSFSYDNLQDEYGFSFLEIESFNKNDVMKFYESYKKNLGSAFLLFNSKQLDEVLTKELESFFKNHAGIKMFIDLSLPADFYHSFFANLLVDSNRNTESTRDEEINEDLDATILDLEKELENIKALHTKVVPQRVIKIKDLVFKTKFMAGEKAGGDFFDVVSLDKKAVCLLSSTSSYVASTMLVSTFSEHTLHEDYSIEDLDKFALTLIESVSRLNLSDEQKKIDLFLCLFSGLRLEMQGLAFGNQRILSSKQKISLPHDVPLEKEFLEQARFAVPLKRGERMFLLSSGLSKNVVFDDQKMIDGKIKDALKGPDDFAVLNDLFFQIKKSLQDNTLKYDASAIMIDVNEGALFEI